MMLRHNCRTVEYCHAPTYHSASLAAHGRRCPYGTTDDYSPSSLRSERLAFAVSCRPIVSDDSNDPLMMHRHGFRTIEQSHAFTYHSVCRMVETQGQTSPCPAAKPWLCFRQTFVICCSYDISLNVSSPPLLITSPTTSCFPQTEFAYTGYKHVAN